MGFEAVDEVPVDVARGRVYEHGWQSWSPTSTYPVTGTSARPHAPVAQAMGYRPELPAPSTGFQAEGVLGVDPGDGGPARLYATTAGPDSVPSIRAALSGDRLVVTADGPVEVSTGESLDALLGAFGDAFAARAGVSAVRPAPTAWCSWYYYWTGVTEADVLENVDAIGEHDLPVDVVQVDDGWQSAIGDWLTLSGRFASLEDLAARLSGAGRRMGIWVAPFLVGAESVTAREHPDWIVGGAGHNWNQPLYGLDLTHPGVRDYLTRVFTRLRGLGVDYFKLDFLYAGAVAGPRRDGCTPIEAYRQGMALIRELIGGSYLLGCGAPILPSVGYADAMRVSPDTAPRWEPNEKDLCMPGQLCATVTTVGRAWQHGRFWANDPDCIIARPEVERREDWARLVRDYGGLRASSDRIAALDEWGLATTRDLLTTVPAPEPLPGVSSIGSPDGGYTTAR